MIWRSLEKQFSIKKIIRSVAVLSLSFTFVFSNLMPFFAIKEAQAAVAFDAATTGTGSSVGSLTFSHTVGAGGVDRLLIVSVSIDNRTVSGVTYGGVAMTSVGSVQNGAQISHMWRLIAPATGANNVVVTMSGGGVDIIAVATSYTGVNQATPLGTPATATGSSVTASVAVASATGEIVVDSVSSNLGTLTVGALQTQRGNGVGGDNQGGSSTEPGDASVTMSWTIGSSSAWASVGVSIKPVAVSTTLATGTDPPATTVAPGAGATDVNNFTFQTSSGTDAITSVTVNLSTNSGIGTLAITDSANTVLGSTASPVTGSNTITVTGLTAGVTATTFKVRATPLSHASQPAVPGASYAITAPVTNWAGTNTQAGSDTNTNALTIDNLSPNGATAVSGTAGDTKNTINWTTSSSADFNTTSGSVVYRWTSGTAGAEVPAEDSTATIGALNGTATTACVVSSALSTALSKIDGTGGSAECTTSALTNGQAYTYKVFQKDTNGNYDAGVLIGTFTPAVGVNITSYTSTETALNYAGACTGCGARIGGGAGFRQSITITGTGFGADPGMGNYSTATNNIKVGTHQIASANVTFWSATSITFLTDTNTAGDADTDWGANYGGAGALVVTAGGGASSGVNFYVFPQVTSLTTCNSAGFPVGSGSREYDATDVACPNGLKDGQIKLVGTRFGTGATGGWVRILGCDVTTCASPTGTVNVDSWANELIQVQVPPVIADTVNSGSLIIQQGTGSNNKTHTYTTTGFSVFPRITGFTPASASEGTAVSVDGNHLCQTGTCPGVFSTGVNDVVFTSAVPATVFTSWTATAMTTAVPTGAVTGNVVLKSNSNASNAKSFTVLSNTPASPASLGQWKNSALSQAIAVGGGQNANNIWLSMIMEVPGITGGTLYPQFEYKPIGTAFACGAGACAVAIEGLGLPGPGPSTGSATTFFADNIYHWQARTKHTKAAVDYYSPWVSFGGNLEEATDFKTDTTAPVITSVSSGTPGTNSATITWNTLGELSDSRIEYSTASISGPTCISPAVCTAATQNAPRVNSHSVSLSNLNSGTIYHYRVHSLDVTGNLGIDPPTGDYTFTTSSNLSPSKTTRFHIVGNTASISGSSNSYTFSVHMPENATTTRSAFVEMKGVFLVGGTPEIGLKVNNEATSTYAFPAGSKYSLKVLHPVSSINIAPDTNTLIIAPGAGNGFYVSSADIYVNYTYTP